MVRRHLTVYHTPNRCWPFWSTGCSIPRPTGPSEKVRKLAANPIFAIIASTKGIDFIIEGTCPRQEPNQRGDVRGEHLCRFGQLTPSQAEHEGKGPGPCGVSPDQGAGLGVVTKRTTRTSDLPLISTSFRMYRGIRVITACSDQPCCRAEFHAVPGLVRGHRFPQCFGDRGSRCIIEILQ